MSPTARPPRYECEMCRDSGFVPSPAFRMYGGLNESYFVPCTACDGKSRLCGEIDESAPETPTLDALRNVKHGGPA